MILLPALSILTPELLLICVATILLLCSAYMPPRAAEKVTFGGAIIALLFTAAYIATTSSDVSYLAFNMFVRNQFTDFVKILLTLATPCVIALSWKWSQAHIDGKAEYPVLVLFATSGLMLLVSAESLLGMYVALELASLSMYVMAAYQRDDSKSSEAGLKYFILGSLASGILLFGMSLIYGFTGTLSFNALSALWMQDGIISLGAITGLILLLIALSFKLSAVPFHMWTPDVYEGGPTPVVAYFATVPKIAILCLLMRLLLQPFAALEPYWEQIIIAMSALSMVVGAVGALTQKHLKRILAYSSIGHIGYMLLAVIAHSQLAVQSLLLYLVIYTVTTLGMFGILLLLKRDNILCNHLDDVRGLSSTHPKLAAALAVTMFSMAGIPPFIGFFAKMFVFAAALQDGHIIMVVLAALTSVIACFYYIRIIKVMYFDEVVNELDAVPLASVASWIVIISLLANLVLLTPSVITTPITHAAAALFP